MNKIWTWFKGRWTAYSSVFWPEKPKKKHDYEYNGNNVLPDPYNKILEEWKTIWTGKNEFKPFLEKEYKTICASAKKHQDYNFWSKRRFIVHLRWVSGLQILYIVIYRLSAKGTNGVMKPVPFRLVEKFVILHL